MRAVVAVAFLLFAAAVGLCGPRPADDDRPGYDERLLREAGLTPSAEALTKFFTDRTPKADPAQAGSLVRQLSSDDFSERERASEGLVALGAAAAPALMRVLSQKDTEASRRAKECLKKVWAREAPVTCVLAARELVRVAPQKAPAVLLGRLPYAWPDERDAIWMALARPGRPDAAYARALSDKEAARRALGGFMLARYGDERERRAAAALLQDADRGVRLRVAQGLLGAGSNKGVPALIGLLSDGPDSVAWQAEELLRWWSGEDGPKPGGDWAAWWKGKPTVKPAKRPYKPRLVLVREMGIAEPSRLALYGCDGRRRWSIEYPGAASPWPDFAFLGEAGVAVAAERVEGRDLLRARDLRGRLLWERPINERLGGPRLRRLPRGTVDTGFEELTPSGGLVRLAAPRGRDFRDELAAWDGHRLEVEWAKGVLAELDREGRVLWRAEVGGRLMAWVRLPGGGVVVAYKAKDGKDAVEEVGAPGKTGWRAQSGWLPRRLAVPFPLFALGF
jgi:hypothetical protein